MSLFPATYEQADPYIPQDQRLPYEAVDTRPVPWHRYKYMQRWACSHMGACMHSLKTRITAKSTQAFDDKCLLSHRAVTYLLQPASAFVSEGQIISDGDIYEMLGLVDDLGNGLQITATMFGNKNIRRALSTEN